MNLRRQFGNWQWNNSTSPPRRLPVASTSFPPSAEPLESVAVAVAVAAVEEVAEEEVEGSEPVLRLTGLPSLALTSSAFRLRL